MTIKENSTVLKDLVITSLDDLKAVNITTLPVSHLTAVTDYMVICTGTSDRHVKALANNLVRELKDKGYSAKTEGEGEGEWILIDAGDAIVHIMLPKTRDFYNLEGLWQDNGD